MKVKIELDGPRHEVERLTKALQDELDEIDRDLCCDLYPIGSVMYTGRRAMTTGTITFDLEKS